ncbi:MAG TPA: outer membrane protein assembly factor BamA [Thermoanaerobaculia bacterium]|nr:outer membrane protein assembly factor BamA [Thermoanaerobaculia bacterium]
MLSKPTSRSLATWCLALLGALAPAAAQEFAGQTIQEIEYHGLETLAEDSMSYYLGLEVGQPLDPAALDARILEFWERELIEDIEVRGVPVEGGVKLVIAVEERPLLRSIDYQGLDKIRRADIADQIDRERIEVYEGSPLKLGELVRLQKAIEALYEEKGFRFAEIRVEVEEISPTESRVIVTLDEGNKVKIGQVQFEGNEVFGAGRLRGTLEKTKKSNLITRIRKRDIYNPATVEEDLETLRKLYRDFGYKDVQTGDPVIEVITKGGEEPDEEAGGKRRLRVIIPIEEGARWRLGEIRLEGNEVLLDSVVDRVFEEPKGGWLREDVIDEGMEKIDEFYKNSGYIFAQMKREIVAREGEELVADVVITVDENDQFRVGRIEFEGNTRTRDRVLRRELRIQEGMVFNAAALRNSLLKINQLEFFKLNEDEPVDLEYHQEEKKVDLVLKGEEAERTELQFGGGFSELDGFFGQFAIQTRNFLGRGETFGVSVQRGRFRNLFDLSYFVPWLRDRPQSVGIQIFDRDLDFDLIADQRFLRKERGAVLTWGRSFRLFESFSMAYTNSEFEDFRSQLLFIDPTMPDGTRFEQEFIFRKSSLTATYRYDSHDSRLEPTRGKRAVLSTEYAGGPLAGEEYFVRPRLQLTYTRPLLRRGLQTVGRVNLEAAYIEPFGTDELGAPRELFFNDRLFLGGETSIRGYRYRSIWVRDPDTGEVIRDENQFPQGGTKSFLLNFEHHFVVSGPFRIVAFADGGNIFGDDQNVSLEDLRWVAGLELRINVPLFGAPLRFIWANQLNAFDDLRPIDQENFESFDFSIGVSF